MTLSRYIQLQVITPYTNETFAAFGASSHVVDPVGEDISGDQQYLYPRTTGIRNVRGRIQGPKKWSGSLDCPVYPTHGTSLIYYALGDATTVTDSPNTDVNTHTITANKNFSIPFFQAGIGRDLNEHRYVGGLVNSFTVDYSPDEILTFSSDVVFRRELTPGALDTGAAFIDFDDVDRAFGGTEVDAQIDAASVTFVESASITVENNVADDAYALGNAHLPAGIIEGLDVSGSFDLRYDALNRYSDFLSGTKRQFTLDATRGAAATLRRVQFDLPKISYDVNRLPTDNVERYVQTLDFTAEPDSNSDPIVVLVTNALTNAQLTG